MTNTDALSASSSFDTAPDTTIAPPAPQEKFRFSGSGSEYFRIWIVNLLLTIVTLGIYSAWAKVRTTRYFYDCTHVADSSFEYHGKPVAILKGRVVAVLLIAAYNLAFKVSGVLGLLMLAALVLLVPWLLWKSLQFKLYNSSYRGVRFGFRGTIGRAYLVYLLLPVLTFLSGYLLAPYAHQQMKKFQHEESRFGSTHFSFQGTAGSFYKAYLIGFLIALAGAVIIAIGFSGTLATLFKADGIKHSGAAALGTLAIFILALYLWISTIYPVFLTIIQNLIWNHTRLGEHRFKSGMRMGRMIFIALTNTAGILITLGLFIPFAQIRTMKYRIESLTLIPNGSLDNFIADTQAQASATGEGVADLLDLDLSL